MAKKKSTEAEKKYGYIYDMMDTLGAMFPRHKQEAPYLKPVMEALQALSLRNLRYLHKIVLESRDIETPIGKREVLANDLEAIAERIRRGN